MRAYLIDHARRWLERGVDAVGRLEEARLPMPWGDNQDGDLLDFYRRLIALRRGAGLVWGGARETLMVDDEVGLYDYTCGPNAVTLNNSPQEVTISTRDWRKADLALATEPAVSIKAAGDQLYLPPYAGAVCRI